MLLLIVLISTNFSRFFICAGFELNHKYIAENLCINKNRPWLHCDGKCYFMKKIKAAQESEKKQEQENHKSRYQEALPITLSSSILTFEVPYTKIAYPRALTPNPFQRYYSILLPPKIS